MIKLYIEKSEQDQLVEHFQLKNQEWGKIQANINEEINRIIYFRYLEQPIFKGVSYVQCPLNKDHNCQEWDQPMYQYFFIFHFYCSQCHFEIVSYNIYKSQQQIADNFNNSLQEIVNKKDANLQTVIQPDPPYQYSQVSITASYFLIDSIQNWKNINQVCTICQSILKLDPGQINLENSKEITNVFYCEHCKLLLKMNSILAQDEQIKFRCIVINSIKKKLVDWTQYYEYSSSGSSDKWGDECVKYNEYAKEEEQHDMEGLCQICQLIHPARSEPNPEQYGEFIKYWSCSYCKLDYRNIHFYFP